MRLEEFLDGLDRVRRSGRGYEARCPAHEDNEPSMTVSTGDDDKIIVSCKVGCPTEDILKAMHLEFKDLFAEDKDWTPGGILDRTYDYVDAHGKLVFQVVRYVSPKAFKQRRPDPSARDGWSWSTKGVDKPLYRLPAVLAAVAQGHAVLVVEGEKDVETAEAQGYVATTNPGGAGGPGQQKWTRGHTQTLAGATVVVVADNDAVDPKTGIRPGLQHGAYIVAELRLTGARVALKTVPEPYKDLTDMVAGGGTLADLVDLEAPEVVDPFEVVGRSIMALGFDAKLDAGARLNRARRLLDGMEEDAGAETLDSVNWGTFTEGIDDPYDWVVPDLLERGDRCIVVGTEGVGKTLLATQMALLLGAGINPFHFTLTDPVPTLFIDLENPARLVRRRSKKIVEWARNHVGDPKAPIACELLLRSQGLNLLDPVNRLMVEALIERTAPEVVFLGPLYKTFVDMGGRNAAALMGEVGAFLDYLRVTYGFALWIETHAPLGDGGQRNLRPKDAAFWSQWPEFGLTLDRDIDNPGGFVVGRFRGDREPRPWPSKFERGHGIPFMATHFEHVVA